MNINISARSLNANLEYIPFKPVIISNKEAEDQTLFIARNIQKEVMRGSEKQQYRKIKQLKKILKISVSILGVMAQLTTRTFAATATNPIAPITPVLVMKIGLTVALISVAFGVALSMTMLSIAGIYRMFRKRKEADMWTTDIIKGLVQVLIAVPTVYLLYFLAQMVFSHLTVLKGIF